MHGESHLPPSPVRSGNDASVCLLNYRSDGTPFWNQFFVAALRDGDGKVVNYLGVQCKVSEEYARAFTQNDGFSSEIKDKK